MTLHAGFGLIVMAAIRQFVADDVVGRIECEVLSCTNALRREEINNTSY